MTEIQENRLTELEMKEKEACVNISTIQSEYEQRYKDLDILASKQEIIRRGVESCIGVLKLGPAISIKTKELAEDKIQEFIKNLSM